MAGENRTLGALMGMVSVLALAACSSTEHPRAVSAETVYGPATLSDWVEIDGRWEVTFSDGEGHALLQPAVDEPWMPDDDPKPREPGAARWIDVSSLATLWSRDELGSRVFFESGVLGVFVGSGDERTLEAVEVATGETLWSIPESDLGPCSGWRVVASREVTDDTTDSEHASRWLPILAAPPECQGSRTLPVELDPRDGATRQLLRGQGTLETSWAGDTFVAMTWSKEAANVRFLDEDYEVAVTTRLSANELLDVDEDTKVWLASLTFVELQPSSSGGVWVEVKWNDPDDEQIYDSPVNEILVDPDTGEKTHAPNDECTFDGEGPYLYTWDASIPLCITMSVDGGDATVTDSDNRSWQMATVSGRPSWSGAECDDAATDEPTDLVLAPATDAMVMACERATGDVAWSVAGDGGRLRIDSNTAADKIVTLTEDPEGRQLLTVLSTCSGTVLSQREVVGAYMEGNRLSGTSEIVTVPLASSTLVATYVERGTPPDEDEEDSGRAEA